MFIRFLGGSGNFSGFIAVIDKDKDSKGIRFKDLEEGKKKVLAEVMLPISIGEAIPHGEAWLLDEEKAVREALYLDGNTEVPGTKVSKNPKETLTELYQESRRASEDRTVVWEDIAKGVDLTKYSRPRETGFARFEKEVKDEIKRAIEK